MLAEMRPRNSSKEFRLHLRYWLDGQDRDGQRNPGIQRVRRVLVNR